MIQSSGFSETTWILRFLLLISVTLISACENKEITKPHTQPEPSEPPLPVSEWYPAPKHRQQPMVYVPVPARQQQPVMAPPVYQGNAVQQPWGLPAQQPVYRTPQPVYQAQPPVNQYQQPQVWTGQPPVVTMPQPVAPQYQPQYQYVPRPWGSLTEPNSNRNSSTGAWPEAGDSAPWSMPESGSHGYGATGGQAGQVPGTVYYNYEW